MSTNNLSNEKEIKSDLVNWSNLPIFRFTKVDGTNLKPNDYQIPMVINRSASTES